MTITLTPAYQDLSFMSPLSDDRADALVDFLVADLSGVVVDIGCGWAELLLRAVQAAPACSGVGIDLDDDAIRHAQSVARQRGLTERVSLIAADVKHAALGPADAVICIGASHAWAPPSEASLPMDYARAMGAIRAMVSPGSRVVYGEAIWSRPPTPEATQPLGGRLDEFASLADVADRAVDAGFIPVAVNEAGIDEWDHFESGYTACYARWLAQNGSQHRDAAQVRARASRQRNGYLRGYRGVLGLAYLQLLAV